jgi:threonine dehydrogenase-like Zn-dependent dehydrogenase
MMSMSLKNLPRTSRAAVVEEFGAPVRITDVPVPQELEPGALLVRTEACSVCGTDLHLWQGELSLNVDLPVILGHEMVGRVVATGPGADRDSMNEPLRVGDRVVWTHTACGRCKFCVQGQPTLCVNRRGYMFETCSKPPYLLGGFSEYVYVLPQAGRVRVPDSVSSDLASIASCALRSVMKAFREVGKLSASDNVLIQGSGPLGLLATAVATAAGARSVTVIGAPAARLELCAELGATNVLDVTATTQPERAALVEQWTEGFGPDVSFEFSGNPRAFVEGLELTARGGRYMVVGQLGKGTVEMQPAMITAKNLSVLGSFSGGVLDYWDALRFFDRFCGDFPFEKLITGTYELETIGDALSAMKAEQEIKPLIRM